MRSTTRATVMAVAAAAGLAATTVPALAAAAARPSHAPLTTGAGAANGCTAVVTLGSGITVGATLDCPASADVHLERTYTSLYEVLPSGRLRTVSAPSLVSKASHTRPLDGPTGTSVYYGCADAGDKGTRKWLARASVVTRSAAGATPYVAKLAVRTTLTCS